MSNVLNCGHDCRTGKLQGRIHLQKITYITSLGHLNIGNRVYKYPLKSNWMVLSNLIYI